ncbi:unnamed protein product [Nezara viridula]|uniref:Gustatory receptor n=1 Tax=Nezara viridula TaxID=85310 RepID=A0A9P0MHS5_NEZVI|nr:unnamed protein product [Nezara viridula]
MLSIYEDQYLTMLSLASGSILHAASMLSTRRLGFTRLFRIIFSLSVVHGSSAMDYTFRFSRCIYCYCLILGIYSLLQDSFWAINNIQEGTLSPGFIVDMLSYVLAYVMWMVMVIELIRQKKGFEQVIRELEKVDTFLQNPKYNATYYLIAFSFAVLTNLIEKVIVGIEYNSFLIGLGYYLYMSPIVVFSSQYFFFMAVASDQFSYLTAQLRSTYRPWYLNDLITIHKSLCDTSKKINSIYGLHLLIITSVPFIINTLKIYSAIMCVIRPDDYDDKIAFRSLFPPPILEQGITSN